MKIERDWSAIEQRLAAGRLTPDDVRKRRGPGGKQLEYLSGGDVLARLNEILGPLGWSEHLERLDGDVVSEVEDDPRTGGKRTTWTAFARAVTRLEVGPSELGVARYGVGHGAADRQVSRAAALELAEKAAHTDAIKRAARTLGAQLGLALYFPADEREEWNGTPPPREAPNPANVARAPDQPSPTAAVMAPMSGLRVSGDGARLGAWRGPAPKTPEAARTIEDAVAAAEAEGYASPDGLAALRVLCEAAWQRDDAAPALRAAPATAADGAAKLGLEPGTLAASLAPAAPPSPALVAYLTARVGPRVDVATVGALALGEDDPCEPAVANVVNAACGGVGKAIAPTWARVGLKPGTRPTIGQARRALAWIQPVPAGV